MPFVSKAQAKACWATNGFNGKIDCHEWAHATPSVKSLPNKVKDKGGEMKYRPNNCMKCGGKKMQYGGEDDIDLSAFYNQPITDDNVQRPPEEAMQYRPAPTTNRIKLMMQQGILDIPKEYDSYQQFFNHMESPGIRTKKFHPFLPGRASNSPISRQNLGIALQAGTTGLSWLSGVMDRHRQNQYDYTQQSTLGQENAMPADDYQPNPYNLYARLGGEFLEMMKKGGWLKDAVNPAHKGYCTPLSKSTCTGHRRAFALMMKKNHGFHKK